MTQKIIRNNARQGEPESEFSLKFVASIFVFLISAAKIDAAKIGAAENDSTPFGVSKGLKGKGDVVIDVTIVSVIESTTHTVTTSPPIVTTTAFIANATPTDDPESKKCNPVKTCPIVTLVCSFLGPIFVPIFLVCLGLTCDGPIAGGCFASYQPIGGGCLSFLQSCGMGGQPVCYMICCFILEALFASAACYSCLLYCNLAATDHLLADIVANFTNLFNSN